MPKFWVYSPWEGKKNKKKRKVYIAEVENFSGKIFLKPKDLNSIITTNK
jgi:hypothetical protein